MSDTQATLEGFFALERARASGDASLEQVDAAASTAKVKQTLADAAKGHSWAAASDEIQNQVSGLLDVSMLDIVVRAWNENKLFERFLNPDEYDPNETFQVSLKKHTIRSKHQPHIDVTLNGKLLGRIDFQIELALTLEGVILTIRGGRVHEVQLGKAQGSGTLKCENLILLKRSSGPVELPGKIRFQERSAVRH